MAIDTAQTETMRLHTRTANQRVSKANQADVSARVKLIGCSTYGVSPEVIDEQHKD